MAGELKKVAMAVMAAVGVSGAGVGAAQEVGKFPKIDAIESACRSGSYWHGGDIPDVPSAHGTFAHQVVTASQNNCKVFPGQGDVGKAYILDLNR